MKNIPLKPVKLILTGEGELFLAAAIEKKTGPA
jgi:hypothetical protein